MKSRITLIVGLLISSGVVSAQNVNQQSVKSKRVEQKVVDYSSKVEKYTFSNSLDEQVKELENNPMLAYYAKLREQNIDQYRPVYHFTNPEGHLNDPNGFCYWQGRWHLFHQAYPIDDRRQHWGHAVSEDLTHWQDLPLAIYPNPERACYSGSILIEDDRALAMYHGLDAGNMIAESSDPLLLNWDKLNDNRAVIPIEVSVDDNKYPDGKDVKYRVFDPFLWKNGDYYYSLSGGTLPNEPSQKREPAAFLFRSKNLVNWEYMHQFVENDKFTDLRDDYACPYFYPLDGGKKYILFFFSHAGGGQYFLGDYDTKRDKFIVTNHGLCNHSGTPSSGGTHAPAAYPDGKGGVITIFNLHSQPYNIGKRHIRNSFLKEYGWDGLMSLPMRFTLGKDGNSVNVEPAVDLGSLRGDCVELSNVELPTNEEVPMNGVSGKAIEINAKLDLRSSGAVVINLLASPDKREYTTLTIYGDKGYSTGYDKFGETKGAAILDCTYSSLMSNLDTRVPERADFLNREDGLVDLQIFIDKSIIEVFVDGNEYISSRVYPTLENSTCVTMKAIGAAAEVISLSSYQMNTIWE